jgi:hypothetical protein
MGKPADAELTFREGLEKRPHNGWSLAGLERALRAQGRGTDADRVKQDFERAWARSDIWLPSARF